MGRYRIYLLVLLAGLLWGCGGGGSSGAPGQVAGVIFDVNGNIVRDARVWVDLPGSNDPETFSNSSGAYVLENIPEGVQIVRAEVVQDGLRYYGQNMIQVFRDERSKSHHVMLVRETQLAGLTGIVQDRFGNRVAGAKIFAWGNSLSSSYAISGADGSYTLGGLQSGLDYLVSASALGHGNDEDVINLDPGELLVFNFSLSAETSPTLPAPQNFSAVSWTSPSEPTRGTDSQAVENIKRIFDPRRSQTVAQGRGAGGDHWIEVDLFWDPVISNQLLGYGIYRGISPVDPLPAIDFLRDVYTEFYADLDEDLQQGITYYYEVTALNTSYPDTGNSESAPSDRYGVVPIGELTLRSTLSNPTTIRWNPASGAQDYTVFVFDRYPGLDVTPIWQSPLTGNTQVAYNGPALIGGNTYYFVVLGLANNNDSRTISPVGEFVAN